MPRNVPASLTLACTPCCLRVPKNQRASSSWSGYFLDMAYTSCAINCLEMPENLPTSWMWPAHRVPGMSENVPTSLTWLVHSAAFVCLKICQRPCRGCLRMPENVPASLPLPGHGVAFVSHDEQK
ncbi:Hypothetical predicted protein [Olea europaea subsp. europaea]|uniref:Uncharacterized protein n=1 Tax=Olea europaea subsp. europaea TaxID=158383 RepID=A0A8S0S6W3_OLEEU|nr:Hypothetical predicted protein [Olea europaea subsp. europaea]